MPNYFEDSICIALFALFAWFQYQHKKNAGLLFHVPNGGNRNAREGGRFKAMGVRPGVSDYLLMVRTEDYAGLWLEIKSDDGRLQKTQREFHADALAQGYAVAVAYGLDQAMTAINDYLRLSSPSV